MKSILFTLLGLALTASSHATTVSYTLDNIFLTATDQMTGTFEWTYNEGDFQNGTGVFTELYIPYTTITMAYLDVVFDITKSIEISLIPNLDSNGVDISLVFVNALTPSGSTLLDLDIVNGSKWSLGGSGINNAFVSGGISPVITAVPVPAAVWLFATGILALISPSTTRRKQQYGPI